MGERVRAAGGKTQTTLAEVCFGTYGDYLTTVNELEPEAHRLGARSGERYGARKQVATHTGATPIPLTQHEPEAGIAVHSAR